MEMTVIKNLPKECNDCLCNVNQSGSNWCIDTEDNNPCPFSITKFEPKESIETYIPSVSIKDIGFDFIPKLPIKSQEGKSLGFPEESPELSLADLASLMSGLEEEDD